MAQDGSAIDAFGSAVAMEGDFALVADRGDAGKGAVWSFVRTAFGWVRTEVLLPADACDAQEFGASLALSGRTLLVGAPSDDDMGGGAGAVYVFFRDDRATLEPTDDVWTEVDKLYAASPRDLMRFGAAVALQGDLAAVGAPGNAMAPAVAYVLLRDDGGTPLYPADDAWSEESVLTADGGSPLTEFGAAVALDDGVLLIGDPRDAAAGSNSGAVFVYKRMLAAGTVRWMLEDKWVPNIDFDANAFGASLDLDGDFAVVGAPGFTVASDGRMYAYRRNAVTNQWVRQVVIDNPTGHQWASFGTSVAASEGRAVGAAPLLGSFDYRGGRVWVFEPSGMKWVATMDFHAADQQLGDHFGTALAAWNGRLLVGAPGFPGAADDAVMPVTGSVAVIDLENGSPWIDLGQGLHDDAPAPCLCGWGMLLQDWPVNLKLYQARPNAVSGLVVGLSTVYAPFKGGTLVPSPDVVLLLMTNGFGEALVEAPWTLGNDLPSRTPFYFQQWIVDPGQAPAGLSASNGLEIRTP
jgi:hypothetical protein